MFLLFIGDAYPEIEIPFVFAKELWSPYCFFLGPDSTRSPFFREWLASGDPLPALIPALLLAKIDEGSRNEIKKMLIPNSLSLGLKDLVINGYN